MQPHTIIGIGTLELELGTSRRIVSSATWVPKILASHLVWGANATL